MTLGRLEEAAISFSRVLALDPGHAEASRDLGQIYRMDYQGDA